MIFTTAYEKYALQGFELEVLDYLLKPIPFERFLRAANKAYDYFRGLQSASGPAEDYIFVKADNKLEKIDFADILFAEALENYVAIYTREKKVITHLTLKMLQEKLPATAFVQPHKSYVIAIDKINSIEGNILHIDQLPGAHQQIPEGGDHGEDRQFQVVKTVGIAGARSGRWPRGTGFAAISV